MSYIKNKTYENGQKKKTTGRESFFQTLSDLEQLLKEVKEKKIDEADASREDSFSDSLAHLSLLNSNI